MIKYIHKLRRKTILPLHNALRTHVDFYDKWHNHRHHKHIHLGVLIIFAFFMGLGFFSHNVDVAAAPAVDIAKPEVVSEALISEPISEPALESTPEPVPEATPEPDSIPEPTVPNVGPPTFAYDFVDASGASTGGSIEFIDPNTGSTITSGNANVSIPVQIPNGGSKVNIKITPQGGPIKDIQFNGVDISVSRNATVRVDKPATLPGWNDTYAVGDVSGFEFTTGRFTAQAEGKDLFKCLSWDFDNQVCTGRWKKVADIVPGEDYTVDFTPVDPGYGEKSNIVNILSKDKELLNYEETVVEETVVNGQTFNTVSIVALADELMPIPLFDQITVNEISLSSSLNDLIIYSTDGAIAQKIIAVDAGELQAKEVQVTKKAKGTALLKCVDINISGLSCNKWKKEKALVVDQSYTLALDSSELVVYGESKDGVLILDDNYEVLSVSEQTVVVEGDTTKRSVQLINLNPYKVTTYFDGVSSLSEIRIDIDETVSNDSTEGKYIALDIDAINATEADIDATAVGYDLFSCTDFDDANNICNGKWKKKKDLVIGENYQFNIKKAEKLQGFFESKKHLSLLGTEESLLDYRETVLSDDGAKETLEIIPAAGIIKKITINDHIIDASNDLKITEFETELQGFGIDPTGLNALSSDLEIEAKGNTLLKCKDWEFETSTCLGEWIEISSLVPGQVYSLTVDSLDPGFKEVNTPGKSSGGGNTKILVGTQYVVNTSPDEQDKETSSSEGIDESLFVNNESKEILFNSKESSLYDISDMTEDEISVDIVEEVIVADSTNTKDVSVVSNHIVSDIYKKPTGAQLQKGSHGEDVRVLQKFLNAQGFILAQSGPGSLGNETEYFGSLTENALIRFQEAHKKEILDPLALDSGTGYYGIYTMSVVKNILAAIPMPEDIGVIYTPSEHYSKSDIESVLTANVESLWSLVKNLLGASASNSDVYRTATQLAREYDIQVPEWGIEGIYDSRELPQATIIDILVTFDN